MARSETYLACHLMALHAMSRQVLLLEAPNEISLAWMVKTEEDGGAFFVSFAGRGHTSIGTL
jgi:hypothetical protein